jgi:GAF domain-containing protein
MEEELKKLPEDTVSTLRTLAHQLSNAIENVMQAAYLLGQSKLDGQDFRWLALINSAAEEAARINREIREILRSRS